MRVLHVLSEVPVPDYFIELARHMDRDRFAVSLCTLERSGRVRDGASAAGVPVFSLDCNARRSYPMAVARLANLLRRERTDIVHTHLFDPTMVGLTAGVIARTPARVMTRWHSDLHAVLGKPVHAWLDKRLSHVAHSVVAVSDYTRQVLTEREGLAPARVKLIYPAIQLPSSSDRDRSLISELGLDNCVVIGNVARLAPVKDQRTLLSALRIVLERHPDVRLVLVGDGPLREPLEMFANELGIRQAVTFAGFRHDLDRFYGIMDVMVHTAIEEAFGLVMIEAMARRIPLVCTPRGVGGEIVRDGQNGLLVEPGQPASLAAAMCRLVVSPAMRRQVGDAGRASVEGRFSFDVAARAHQECYLGAMRLQ